MKTLKKALSLLLCAALLVGTATSLSVNAAGFKNPALPNYSGNKPDPFVKYIDGYYYGMWTINSRLDIVRSSTMEGMASCSGDYTINTIYCNGMSNFNDDFYTNFWAPEFYHDEENGKWYVYASATAKGVSGGSTIFCLESKTDDIMGDYIFKSSLGVSSLPWQIDPSIYKAPSGQLYMTFVSGNDTNDLYIAKMKNCYKIDASSVTKISSAEYSWELQSNKVNEGGAFLESGGNLYMSYSANDCLKPEYCVGLLRFTGNYKTDNLCDASKWSKYTQPLLKKGNGINCTGHNSFLTGPDGKTYIVYHCKADGIETGKNYHRFLCFQELELDAAGAPKLNQVPKVYQKEPQTASTEYTYEEVYMDECAVTNHYSIGENYNGHGIACQVKRDKLNANINEAQTYADMVQNGFHDNVNAPYVAVTVKAPENGMYGLKVGYGIDSGFTLSKTKPYYIVVAVNDKDFYKGTERTLMTNGGYLADTMEVYLEKGVNIIRVLTLVPEVAKNYTSAWANVRYLKLDSRATAIKKSQYGDRYIERDGITSYGHYTKADNGIVNVNPADAKSAGINYDTCTSYSTFINKLPYVAMDMYAPYDGYYDISFYMQVGNTKSVGYYVVYVDEYIKYQQKLYSMGTGQTSRISGVYLTKGTHSIAISSALGYSTSDYTGGYSYWSDYFSLFYRYYDDKAYTVTLDSQGADTLGTGSFTVTYGAALPEITLPKRAGYSFDGYYTEQNGGGTKYYNADGTPASTYKAVASTTLYAKWVFNTVEAKSSDEAMGTVFGTGEYSVGTEVTLTATAKNGYHFVAWTDSVGNTLSNDNTYTFKVEGADGVTYIAKFAPDTDTAYKVNHWHQQKGGSTASKNDKNYTIFETESFSGTTAQSVTPAVKSYTDYIIPTAKTVTILGDGTSVTDYYYGINYGDVNSDKAVDISDAAALKKHLLGQLDSVSALCSDVNGNGEVSLTDLLRLKRYLADPSTPLGDDVKASVSVMYYNVYGYYNITTPDRLDMQVDMIADNLPDILCTQEFDYEHRKAAKALLRAKGYREVPISGNDTYLYNNSINCEAMFYRSDNVELIESCGTLFPTDVELDGITVVGNNGNTKSYTWAVFREKTSGKLFIAVNAHFMYNGASLGLTIEQARAVRANNAKIINQTIDTVRGSKAAYKNIPVVFGGDLNCTAAEEAFSVLSKKLDCAAYVAEEYKKLGYYGCYAKYNSSTGEYTYYQPTESDHIIDHAFVKGAKVKSYLPVTEFRALVTSDHLPWIVDMEF